MLGTFDKQHEAPSVLSLTRQNLPTYRDASPENKCAKGAYVLSESAKENADVSIFASGSEVEIAMEAKSRLSEKGLDVRVISVPCMDLFFDQDEKYISTIFGSSKINVAVEAGVRQSWDRFIGNDGIFVGMKSFGRSAPFKQLYEKFGITTDAVVEAVMNKI